MKSALLRAMSILIVCAPLVAHADTTYDFTAVGTDNNSNPINASGSFVVGIESPYTSGAYEVTSITGTFDGTPISLMPGSYDVSNPTSNANPFNFQFDNLFYPSGPYFDFLGLGIDVGNSGYEINFYYDSGLAGYRFFDSTNAFGPVTFTLTPAATPEPSSLLLLGTGLVGFAGALRRRLTA